MDKILFVVVLYNQHFYNTNIYITLLNKINTSDIWIWDNSTLKSLNSGISEKYTYNYSSQNIGVSAPYNHAAVYAQKMGYEWLLLLDQDTMFNDDYLEVLLQTMTNNENKFSLFCPIHKTQKGNIISPVCKKRLSFKKEVNKTGELDLSSYSIINSGLLISLSLFNEVGGYDENCFLDYSDYQFLRRCRKRVSSIICMDTTCLQDFSGECNNKIKLINRYKLFCLSLKNSKKDNIFHSIDYMYIAFKRCVSLIVKLRSLEPLYIFLNKYMK